MQDHSTIIDRSPSALTAKEIHVRRNVAFVSELDAKMKNDINAARRKLTNSVNTNNIREINFRVSGRPPQLLQFQNQISSGNRLLRAERSEPHLISQPGVAYYHQTTTVQMPEENDGASNQLRKELIETRRELEAIRQNYHQADSEAFMRANQTIAMLQQTINQNDVNSRQTISNLQRENEQLKISIHNVRVQLQSREKQGSEFQQQKQCQRCYELQERIRNLQAQLLNVNSCYEKQRSKLSLFQQQQSTFKNELQNRISNLADKLNASQSELQRITSEKFQLQKKIVQINTRDLSSFNEETEAIKQSYNILSQQYDNVTSQNELLSRQHSQAINQLNYVQRKLYQMHFELDPYYKQGDQYDIGEVLAELQNKIGQINSRLSERSRENQEFELKLNQKETNFKKLSEEYSELLERTEKYQEKIEELQRELSVKIVKEDNKIEEIQDDLMEALKKERFQAAQLKRRIQEREEDLTEVRQHLSEAQNYINHTVAVQFQQQAKTIQTLTSQNSELQSRLQRPNSQLQFYQTEIKRLEDQLKIKSNQSSYHDQISTLEQIVEQERRQRSRLENEYNHLGLVLEKKQQQLMFVYEKLNDLESMQTHSKEVDELKRILESRQDEFNRQLKSIQDQYERRIMNATSQLRDQIRGLENENQNMIHQIEQVPQLKLQLSKCNQYIKQLDSQLQKSLRLIQSKSQQIHSLEMTIEALQSREVRDGYSVYESGSRVTDSQSSNAVGRKEPSQLPHDYPQVAHLEANIAELRSEIDLIKTKQQAKIEEATSKLLRQNQTLQREITQLQQSRAKKINLQSQYQSLQTTNYRLSAIIEQLTQQNQRLSSEIQIVTNNLQQAQFIFQEASHKLNQQERYYGKVVDDLQSSLKQVKDKSQFIITKLKTDHQQQLSDLNSDYQQKLNSLKLQLQSQYEAELLQARRASSQQLQNTIDTKQQTIQKLLKEIEVMKTQGKSKGSSEKYGELVIKHNTLNIDYQNLVSKSKQREELLTKQKQELTQKIESVIKESDFKIKELVEANVKLSQESQIHYNHLEHAEAYIAEILDKLAALQAKESKPETDDRVYREEIARLQSQLTRKVDEERATKDLAVSFKISIETLTRELEASQKELAHFRQLSDTYLSNQKALEADKAQLSQTIRQLQNQIDLRSEQIKQLTNIEANNQRAEITQLISKVRTLQSQNVQSNNQIIDLRKQITERVAEIKRLSSQTSSNDLLKQSQDEIANLLNRLRQLEGEKYNSDLEITRLRSEVNRSSLEIQRLHNEVNRLSINQSSMRQSEEYQEDNALLTVRNEVKERELRMKEIQAQNQRVRELNIQMQRELQLRMAELMNAQRTIEQMRSKLHLDSSSRRSDSSEYRQTYSRIEKELQESRHLLNGASEHIVRLQEVISRAEQQIRGLNGYILELQKKSQASSQRSSSPVKAFEAEAAEERWKQQILKLQSQNLRLSSVVRQLSQHIERVNENSRNSVSLQQKQLNKLIQQNESRLNHINQLTSKLLALQKENIIQNQKSDQIMSALTVTSNEKDKKLKEIQIQLKEAEDKAIYFQNKLKEAENYIFSHEAERQKERAQILHLVQEVRKLEEVNALQLKQIDDLGKQLASPSPIRTIPTNATETQELKQRVLDLERFKQAAEKELLQSQAKIQELNTTLAQVQSQYQRTYQIIGTLQSERQQKQELVLKNTSLIENIEQLKKLNAQQLNQSKEIILRLQIDLNRAREDLKKIQDQKTRVSLELQHLLEQKQKEVQRNEQERLIAESNHQKTLETQRGILQEKQKQLQFFRSKLIEAEDYIVYLEKIKSQLEGNSLGKSVHQTQPSTFDAKLILEENEQLKDLISNYEQKIEHFQKNYIPQQVLQAAVSRQQQKAKAIQRSLNEQRTQLKSKEQKILEQQTIINSLEAQVKIKKIEQPVSTVPPMLESKIQELEKQLSVTSNQLKQSSIRITNLENENRILVESNRQFEFVKQKLIEAEQYIFYLEDLKKKEVQHPFDSAVVLQLEQKIKLLESEKQRDQLKWKQAEQNIKKSNQELYFIREERKAIEVKLVQSNQALVKAEGDLENIRFELTKTKESHQLLQKEKDQAKHDYHVIALQIKNLSSDYQSLKADNIKLSDQLSKEQQSHAAVASTVRDLSQQITQISNKLVQSQSKIQDLSSQKKLIEAKLEEYRLQMQKNTEEAEFFKTKLSQAEAYIYELEQIKPVESFEIHVPQSSGDNSELQTTIDQLEGIIKDLTEQKESVIKELQNARVNYQKIQNILKETEGKLIVQEQRVFRLTQQKQIIQRKVTQSEGILLSNIERIQDLQDKLYQAEQKLIDSTRNHNQIVIDLTRQIESLRDKLSSQSQILDAAERQQKQPRVEKAGTKDMVADVSEEVHNEEFFKNKLLIAEEYIQTLEQQKIQVQSSRQTYYNKSIRQEEDLLKLTKQLNHSNEALQMMETKICQLQKENQYLNEHLRVVTSQESNDEIIRLTSQLNQLKKDFQTQQQITEERIQSLQRRNDQLQSFYRKEKEKCEKTEENVKSLEQAVTQIKQKAQYYQKKYQESQLIISTLQDAKAADKEILTNIATISKLQLQIDSLHQAKQAHDSELTSTRQQIKDLSNKNTYFRQKLLEAEGYIVQLQKERRKSQDQYSNDSHMDILRDKIVQLEERKREVEMKLILAEEKEKGYVEAIRTLEAKVSFAEGSLVEAEKDIAQAIQKDRNQQSFGINLEQELSKLGKDPQREKEFFKNKLLAAEAYITDLLKQKKQRELRSPEQQPKFDQLNYEINRLNEEAVFNQATIQNLHQKNGILTEKIRELQQLSEEREKEIQSFRQDARQFTAMLQEKQIRYDQHINMLTQELQQKMKIIQQLQNQRDDAEQEAQAAEEKATELIERENASNKASEQSSENIDFFKGKLFEAEAYIKDLEDEKEASTRAMADLNTKIMKLDEEISNLKDRNSVNNSLNSEPANDEQKIVQILAEAKSQIFQLKEENDRLRQQLATIRVESNQTSQPIEEESNDVTYLKNKLYEAESYIVELERQNSILSQEATDREDAVKALQNNINLLTEQSVEAQLINKQLQLQIDEIKQENSQLKEQVANAASLQQSLSKKVTQLQCLNTKVNQERQKQIQNLRAELVAQNAGQKESVESKYKLLLEKKEEEINILRNNLDKTLQDFDNLKVKDLQVQEESEKNTRECKFFQGKLLEAQSYITELQKQNEDLNTNCEELKQRILTLQVNINVLTDKINQVDTQKLVITGEINTLKQENLNLRQSIEQYKAKETDFGSKQSEIVATLKQRIQEVQEELKQEQLKNQVEFDLLNNTLNKKEDQLKRVLQKLEKSNQDNSQLRKFYSIQQNTNQNIEKYVKFKEEGSVDLESSVPEELEAAHNEITRLQEQNIKKHNFTEELLQQIKRISQENNRLTQDLYKLSTRNIEEEGEGQQKDIDNNQIFQERTIKKADRRSEQQEVISTLMDQITSLKSQVEQKSRIIEIENTATMHIQQEMTTLQMENERLKEKVEQLEEIQRQFEEFKAVVKQREEAQRQLQEVEKELSQPQIKKEPSQGASSEQPSRQSPSKNRRLQQSLEEASKELQDEMKEQTNQEAKELMKEISNLKVILQQTEDENAVLKLEKTNQMKVILEIGETNGNLQKAIQSHKEKQLELQEAIVLSETQNLALTSKIQQLCIKLNQSQSHLNVWENRFTTQQAQKQSKIGELQATVQELKGQNQQFKAKIQSLQAKVQQSQINLASQQEQSEFPQVISPQKRQESESLAQQENWDSNQQIESLNAQLQQEREHLVMAECEIQELKTRLQQYQQENKQKSARIQQLEFEAQRTEEQLIKRQEIFEEDITQAQKRISSKSIELETKEEKLSSSIRRLLTISQNHQEETADPTEVLQELEEFPYLNELITSILYRLRLSSAIELEKGLKIQSQKETIEQLASKNHELEEELIRARTSYNLLKQQNDILKNTNQKMEAELLKKFEERREQAEQAEQSERSNEVVSSEQMGQNEGVNRAQEPLDERYNQLLKELVDYEAHNSQLQARLAEITQYNEKLETQIDNYKDQIKVLSASTNLKDLSLENLQLRKKLEESQNRKDNSSIGTHSLLRLEFLQVCLERVDQIERQVRLTQQEFERVACRERRMGLSSNQGKIGGEDSQLIERLQQLEERLMKNASNIIKHQQNTDGELYGLLKELLDDEQISEDSKKKIEDYLQQLQQQILREHEEHQAQLTILREQIARKQLQQRPYSDRSRDDLLREINNLNSAIEIYHQQSMRRKKLYKSTLGALLEDIYALHQKRQDQQSAEIVRKIQEALEREEVEDLEFDGDDFIIAGGSGHVQVLEGRQKEKDPEGLYRLKESVGELGLGDKSEPIAIQTEADAKPFLKYLLSAQDIDKQDLKLLKRKIAELRGRQVEQNLQILKGKEKRLQQVLQMSNRQASPQQIENIMVTLANNYSRDEISQIFGSEDADELINKLNQALCLEESFYKAHNSSALMHEIEERKKRYYETPTKLSEEVYKHLLLLLSAKKDQEFYEHVQSLFRSMYEVEDGFQIALKKKDQIYKSHNQRMNQIFNRSSSDNSEDYLAEFERSNEQEMRIQSERKAKKSEENSEEDQELRRQ